MCYSNEMIWGVSWGHLHYVALFLFLLICLRANNKLVNLKKSYVQRNAFYFIQRELMELGKMAMFHSLNEPSQGFRHGSLSSGFALSGFWTQCPCSNSISFYVYRSWRVWSQVESKDLKPVCLVCSLLLHNLEELFNLCDAVHWLGGTMLLPSRLL